MKYIITWDCGYGPDSCVIEAPTHDLAMEEAYAAWREAAEADANYAAYEYTDELAEELL